MGVTPPTSKKKKAKRKPLPGSESPGAPGGAPTERTSPPDSSPTSPAPREKPEPKRATELSTKLVAALGMGAAVVLTVVVSILSARHYKRWDLTRGGLFTLSPASVETLRGLPEPVKLILLMGDGDPMRAPVDETLTAYRALSDKLVVEYADPDKRPAEFLAVQQQYELGTSDASMIVVRGDKHFFISPKDLVQYDEGDETRASPRIEQAITGALRNVVEETRTIACVTQGHGEPQLEAAGDAGLVYLRDRLVRNNFEPVAVFGDPSNPMEGQLHDCDFLLVAGPTSRLPPEESKEIEGFIQRGGNAVVVLGPVPYEPDNTFLDVGLGGTLALAGVKLADNFVIEFDPKSRMPSGFGDVFYAQTQNHPVTASLLREEMRVRLEVSGTLKDLANDTTPLALLKTTDKSAGISDFFSWAKGPASYSRKPADVVGPFMLAAASERAKVRPTDERGARIVTIASLQTLFGINWREPGLRGTATFVESAITWASSHRSFLDIPDKPTMTMGLRLTEESLSSIRTYVFALPVLASFAGIAAFLLRRRRTPAEPKS